MNRGHTLDFQHNNQENIAIIKRFLDVVVAH